MKNGKKKENLHSADVPPPIEKLGYSLSEVSQLVGVSRSALYKEIREGRLIAFKVGTRTIITKVYLDAFLKSLQPFVQA